MIYATTDLLLTQCCCSCFYIQFIRISRLNVGPTHRIVFLFRWSVSVLLSYNVYCNIILGYDVPRIEQTVWSGATREHNEIYQTRVVIKIVIFQTVILFFLLQCRLEFCYLHIFLLKSDIFIILKYNFSEVKVV